MTKPVPPPRIQSIHNPTLKGKPVLLMPEGRLIRWPDRMALPKVGDEFTDTVVHVPSSLQQDVLLLCDPCPFSRCDAAKRLSESHQGGRIMLQLFSRSLVQKMVTAATRLVPEIRELILAHGQAMSLRRLFKLVYARH